MSSPKIAQALTLFVDQSRTMNSPPHQTVDMLFKSLTDFGPMVGVGQFGPSAYTEEPISKGKFGKQNVFVWKPNTNKETNSVSVIILSGKTTKSQSVVYYTLAEDVTQCKDSSIRRYTPSSSDKRIFAISFNSFHTRASNLYPICPHGNWLFLTDIMTLHKESRKCEGIGKEIFRSYTQHSDDKSVGEDALMRIADASNALSESGDLRRKTLYTLWQSLLARRVILSPKGDSIEISKRSSPGQQSQTSTTTTTSTTTASSSTGNSSSSASSTTTVS